MTAINIATYVSSGSGSNADPYILDLQAAVDAMAWGDDLHVPSSVYQFNSAVTIDKPVTIYGTGPGSVLRPSVGATADAITVGNQITSQFEFSLRNVSISGAANCCKNALVLNKMHIYKVRDLTVTCGAVENAIVLNGCIYVDLDKINIHQAFGGATWARPKNGILIQPIDSPAYQSNAIKIHANISALAGYGIFIKGSLSDNTPLNLTDIEITGTFEYIAGYAIYALNADHLTFWNVYGHEHAGGALGFRFEDCNVVNIYRVKAAANGLPFQVVNSKKVHIEKSSMGLLTVDSDSSYTVVEDLEFYSGFINESPTTIFRGYLRHQNIEHWPEKEQWGEDKQNLIYNSSFSEWSSNAPIGWADQAGMSWEQCGDGLSDTTRHWLPRCAKSIADVVGTNFTCDYYLDDDEFLSKVKGKFLTFSAYVNTPSIEDGSAHPYIYMTIYAPSLGVDGRCDGFSYSFSHADVDDSGLDGEWVRHYVCYFVPEDATSVRLQFSGNTTHYIAEPFLGIGRETPSGFILPYNEFPDKMIHAGYTVDFGAAVPTTGYFVQGSRRWTTTPTAGGSPGWVCTTSGTPGTWKAMPNLEA